MRILQSCWTPSWIRCESFGQGHRQTNHQTTRHFWCRITEWSKPRRRRASHRRRGTKGCIAPRRRMLSRRRCKSRTQRDRGRETYLRRSGARWSGGASDRRVEQLDDAGWRGEPDERAEARTALLSEDRSIEQRKNLAGLVVIFAPKIVNLLLDLFGARILIFTQIRRESFQLRAFPIRRRRVGLFRRLDEIAVEIECAFHQRPAHLLGFRIAGDRRVIANDIFPDEIAIRTAQRRD